MTASAFTATRHANKKAWLYRARPAVAHQGFVCALYPGFEASCMLTKYRPICRR
jgi:homogentisate 1,2-dioxygenase